MLPAFRANSLCWRSKVVKRSRVIPDAFAWSSQSGDYQSVVAGVASLWRSRPSLSVWPAPALPPDDETPPVAPDHGEFIG